MLSWKRAGRDAGVAEWPRRVLEFGVVGVIRFLIVFFSAILLSLGAAAAGDYEDGGAAYERGDFATAKRLWLPLAEQGDAKAQTGLALMYFLGQGVDMNLAAALDWCGKAADHGLPTAQFPLGQIYEHPWDPEIRDLGTAFKWYSKAAAQAGRSYRSAKGDPATT